MTNQEINQKIAELRKIEEQAAVLAQEVEAIKDSLKHELDTRKVDSVDTGLHRVFYNCYEKFGVDTAKLKSSGLYEQFCKKSAVIQFKITDVKAI